MWKVARWSLAVPKFKQWQNILRFAGIIPNLGCIGKTSEDV